MLAFFRLALARRARARPLPGPTTGNKREPYLSGEALVLFTCAFTRVTKYRVMIPTRWTYRLQKRALCNSSSFTNQRDARYQPLLASLFERKEQMPAPDILPLKQRCHQTLSGSVASYSGALVTDAGDQLAIDRPS
jgi:hypothetical protein